MVTEPSTAGPGSSSEELPDARGPGGGAGAPNGTQGAPGGDGAPGGAGAPPPPASEFVCPVADCGFIARSLTGLRSHATRSHGADKRDDGAAGTGEVAGGPAPGDVGETRPEAPRRRGFRELLKGRTRAEGATTRPKRTWTPGGRRESLDEPFQWAYGGIGTMIIRGGGEMVPVGRVMEMQAPAVGEMLDEAVKGTIADRLLQPLVRQGQAFKQISETLGLPMMTAIIIRRPALLGLHYAEKDGQTVIVADGPLYQPYYSLWEANAVNMAKGYERRTLARQKTHEELRKIEFLAPVIEQGTDPILWLMVQTLGDPIMVTPPGEPVTVAP